MTSIRKETIKRLANDIVYLKKNPLHDNGIYYQHDENNILKGYALIIGPKDTPYEGGYYFFEITYPYNYPHEPPVYKFLSNDGNTRFNPNLYKNGKVCLSILNTWHGEQWSGCQTISSTLLAICTVLNDKPLLNEPGITEQHSSFNTYQQAIEYKNFDFAMTDILKDKYIQERCNELFMVAVKNFIETYDDKNLLLEKIMELRKDLVENPSSLYVSIYCMSVFVNYKNIKNKLEKIKKYCEEIK